MAIIGREPPADVVVPMPQVSARHAEIRPLPDGGYQLTDLGSSNGTFVNGQRITSTRIAVGDRINLGSFAFDLRAHAGGVGASAMPHASAPPPAARPAAPPAVAPPVAAAAPSRPAPVASAVPPAAPAKNGSVGAAIFWMFFLSLLLFWLPLLGPFIAGLVGGKKAGGVGAAFAAVLLPSLVFGAVIFVLATSLTGIPLLGAIAGAGAIVLCLAHVGPMLAGAVIGGLMA